MFNILYKNVFFVSKMQNMLLNDLQCAQHLPDLSIGLCSSISQVDSQGK